ncbi:MAG: C1 family peptidase [Bacteroidales bacterium]|nr:C1 family peptidase [Bacteroidales bacterium]
MTPIVIMWSTATLDPLVESLRSVLTARQSEGMVTMLRSTDTPTQEEFTRRLVEIHRNVIQMAAYDTTLHIYYLSPASEDAVDETLRVVRTADSLPVKSSIDVIALHNEVINAVFSAEESASEEHRAYAGRIMECISACSIPASLTIIDNYLASRASVNFTLEALTECLSEFFNILIDNYPSIVTAAAVDTMRGSVRAIGLSRLDFPRDKVIDYLLHRSFVAALERDGVRIETVDIVSAMKRAEEALKGFDKFYPDFMAENVEKQIQLGRTPEEIAPSLSGTLTAARDAAMERMTRFLSDKQLQLPDKEATMALILGLDNEHLKGITYADDSLTFDNALEPPLDVYIDAYNTAMPDSGLLPIRASYPLLRYPDISLAGIAISDSRNFKAFNPLNDIQKLKREILDLTSYLRSKTKELDKQRREDENSQRANTVLTDNGFESRTKPLRPSAKVVERPLEEEYTPAKDLKAASSVDLRKYLSKPRNQNDTPACASFAVAGMYEALWNRYNAGEELHKLSPAFLFYNSNVIEKQASEGSNFYAQLDVLTKKGICEERFYDIDISKDGFTLPPVEAYGDAEKHRLIKALQIPISRTSNKFDDLKANHELLTKALTEGYPVGISLKIYDEFLNSPFGHISRPNEATTRQEEGSLHAMLIVGYNDEDKYYILRNSWGEQWGDNGYCYISAAYIDDPDFNNYCCILTECTDTAGADHLKKPVPNVAQLNLTQAHIRIMALSNALEYAQIELTSKKELFNETYTYYSNLLAKLELPMIRRRISDAYQTHLTNNIGELTDQVRQLTDELPENVRTHKIKYITGAIKITAIALGICLVYGLLCHAGVIDVLSLWTIIPTLAVMVVIAVWGAYTYAKQKYRKELQQEIDKLSFLIADLQKKKDRAAIRFHCAGIVIDELLSLRNELTESYHSLRGFNNNLRQWHTDDSARASKISFVDHPMFDSVTTPELLVKFFDRNVNDIISNIDLSDAFRTFHFSLEGIHALRDQLEEVTRTSIDSKLDEFNIADYICGTVNFPYAVSPDTQNRLVTLNRRAELMIRHSSIGSHQNRYLILNSSPNTNLTTLRQLGQHFSNPPQILGARHSDSMTILTIGYILPGDIQ